MVLRESMWELFLNTGNIDAYLTYRACLECDTSQLESQDETMSKTTISTKSSNNLVREVQWQ